MKKITVRLDDDLHARIEHAAAQDRRSLNRQIEWLLAAGLDVTEMTPGGTVYSKVIPAGAEPHPNTWPIR